MTAVNVRHSLELDALIMMVNNVPWQKEGDRPITPALDRLSMVEAAIRDIPGLEAGRLEIDLGGPSYTADTLAALQAGEPDVELFTIVGDDAAAGMLTWERWQEVVERSTVVVVDRPGVHFVLPTEIPWVRVEVPRLEVSSTDLRARFVDGRPLDYLLTDHGPRRHRAEPAVRGTGVTVSRHRRRVATSRALIAAIVGVVLAVVLGGIGAVAIYNTKDGQTQGSGPAELTFPDTPTALIAVVDDSGDLGSVAAVAVRPAADAGRGGTIMPIAVSTDSSGGFGNERAPLNETVALFGIDSLPDEVSLALGLSLDDAVVLDRAQLASLLTPLGDVSVTLPAAVTDADGTQVAAAGPQTMSPDTMAAVLAAADPAVPGADAGTGGDRGVDRDRRRDRDRAVVTPRPPRSGGHAADARHRRRVGDDGDVTVDGRR